MNRIEPCVIGISGISGAGKSTLVQRLANTLQATTIAWDDYDAISKVPVDYVRWYESSRSYEDWIYDDLGSTLKQLKSGLEVDCPATGRKLSQTPYILFDAPLGLCHRGTGYFIDLPIFLDTPLDLALARRLLRDYQHHPQKVIHALEEYTSRSRPLYVLGSQAREGNLVIDGTLSIEEQEQQVLEAIKSFRKMR